MQIKAFDFETKEEILLAPGGGPQAPRPGLFHWFIASPDERADLLTALEEFGMPRGISDLLRGPQPEVHLELHEEAIHFTLSEVRIEDGELKGEVLSFLLGGSFLVALVPSKSPVMERILRVYGEDFRKFARTSGFLLYELGTQLLESYRRMFQYYTEEAERIQMRLFRRITDEIFAEVSELTGDILAFRRVVLFARDLFNDLATRKSAFVAESAQPALDILSDRLERLGSDIAGMRSVLNETLNLYMGMVSHRTNRIVNRLTIISMLFMPLSFMAGVYGMNFHVLPELGWAYSYPLFWGFVIVFVTTFVIVVRRKKWL